MDSTLVCVACSCAFQDTKSYRLHYKTEWHRFNLKRKVAGLKSITEELFLKRQQANQQSVMEFAAS